MKHLTAARLGSILGLLALLLAATAVLGLALGPSTLSLGGVVDALTGEETGGAAADIVALNAGAGLHVAGVADSIADGLERARAALAAGDAAVVLERLASASS